MMNAVEFPKLSAGDALKIVPVLEAFLKQIFDVDGVEIILNVNEDSL